MGRRLPAQASSSWPFQRPSAVGQHIPAQADSGSTFQRPRILPQRAALMAACRSLEAQLWAPGGLAHSPWGPTVTCHMEPGHRSPRRCEQVRDAPGTKGEDAVCTISECSRLYIFLSLCLFEESTVSAPGQQYATKFLDNLSGGSACPSATVSSLQLRCSPPPGGAEVLAVCGMRQEQTRHS